MDGVSKTQPPGDYHNFTLPFNEPANKLSIRLFSTAEIFDPDTGDWTRIADMPKPLMSAKVPNSF